MRLILCFTNVSTQVIKHLPKKYSYVPLYEFVNLLDSTLFHCLIYQTRIVFKKGCQRCRVILQFKTNIDRLGRS